MNKKEHNGWSSYETWNVKLWIDNEQSSQEYWQEQALKWLVEIGSGNPDTFPNDFPASFTLEERAMLRLSKQLETEHEESLPELSGFAADLLNAAMNEVNWHEIAKSLIEDAKQPGA